MISEKEFASSDNTTNAAAKKKTNGKALSPSRPATTSTSTTSISKPRTASTARKVRKQPVKRVTSSAASSRSNRGKSKHGSYVYVRVRPLLDADEKPKDEDNGSSDADGDSGIDPDLVTTTCISSSSANDVGTAGGKVQESNLEVFAATTGSLPITGFHGILGTTENNESVYQHTFLPRLSTVMQGGTSSLFCYGYTGAGKTHTTLGYNDELGLYTLASQELLTRVTEYNEKYATSTTTKNDDESTSDDDTSPSSGKEPLILLASVVEVYNDDVLDILGGRAKCSLRKNHKGQLLVRGATRKHTFTEEQAKENGFEFSVVTSTLSAIQVKTPQDLQKVQQTALQHRAVGISTEHSQSSRSHAIFRLDIVNQTLLKAMDTLEEAESIKPAVQTAYDKKRTYALRHWVLDIEKTISETNEHIEKMYRDAAAEKSPFGGRLILVDLAGADNDTRATGEGGHTVAQRKESTAINKSLLALKECIRGLQQQSTTPSTATGRTKALPFRNSSLTRLLEEVLTPREKRDSNSVMIVNVAPSVHLKSKTTNSLRYGQMFSASGSSTKRSSTGAATKNTTRRAPSRSGMSLKAAKERMAKREGQSA